MKKISLLLFSLLAFGFILQSCDNSKTYAEMLEDQKDAIKRYISKNDIRVISEGDFFAQDSTTDVSLNQYVLFNESGVYMQIIDEGVGRKAESNDQIIVRFLEYGIMEDSVIWTNFAASDAVDTFRYTKSGTSSYASFVPDDANNYGPWYSVYGVTVPSGWLVPLNYVKLGTRSSQRARVKLIVPASAGHEMAAQYIQPYAYELTFQFPN